MHRFEIDSVFFSLLLFLAAFLCSFYLLAFEREKRLSTTDASLIRYLPGDPEIAFVDCFCRSQSPFQCRRSIH